MLESELREHDFATSSSNLERERESKRERESSERRQLSGIETLTYTELRTILH